MSVRLVVNQRSEEGAAGDSRELLIHDPVINLGRDKTSQVVLPQQAVSRTHARISRDGALFFIEDLGSVYGTQVNGQALPKGEKRLLRDGDQIAIAQFDVTFERLPDVPENIPPDHTSMVARHMVKNAMRALGGADGPYLRIMNGPDEGRHIQLSDAQEVVMGRDDDVDVVLKDDLVSRRHAKVRRDWAGSHIEDLGSRNGVRVNRKRVTRKTLTDRDEVEIGGVKLLYVDPSEVQDARPAAPPEEEGEDTPPTGGEDGDAPPREESSDVSGTPLQARGRPAPSEKEGEPEEPEPASPDPSVPVAELEPVEAPLEQEEEPPPDLSSGAWQADNAPRQMQLQQWIVLGAAGVAAVLVLVLVMWVLFG